MLLFLLQTFSIFVYSLFFLRMLLFQTRHNRYIYGFVFTIFFPFADFFLFLFPRMVSILCSLVNFFSCVFSFFYFFSILLFKFDILSSFFYFSSYKKSEIEYESLNRKAFCKYNSNSKNLQCFVNLQIQKKI